MANYKFVNEYILLPIFNFKKNRRRFFSIYNRLIDYRCYEDTKHVAIWYKTYSWETTTTYINYLVINTYQYF